MKSLIIFLIFFTSSLHAQVFKIGYLFDSKNARWLKDQVLVVKDGEISEINPTKTNHLKVIDLSKKWILPGLIDAHSHLFLNDTTYSKDFSLGLKKWVRENKEKKMSLSRKRAKEMAQMGFTLVRDLGNQGQITQKDIESISSLLITSSGPGYTPKLGQLPTGAAAELALEYRKLNSDLDDHYYPLIKLYADEDPNSFFAQLSDLQRLTTKGHQLNKLVAIHAILPQGIELALKSGADTLEHGSFITNAQLKDLKKTSMVFVPTHSEILFISPHRRRYWQEYMEKDSKRICQNIKKAQGMNITIAFGSDHYFDFAGEDFGENLIEILTSYLRCGMNANEILQMVTYHSALTQNQFRVGELKLGYLANFNVYDQSPALDLNNLKKIESIYRRGEKWKEE